MRSYSSVAPVRYADRLAGAALVLTLAIAWVHLALTGRWADVPGAVHGPRFPYYVTALALVSLALLASRLRPATVVPSSRAGLASAALGGGLILVATAFLVTFPPSTWSAVPFYDDWPGLLQLTMNGIDLLHHGAVVGWQWAFLGGYQTSADLSQSLALPAFLPVALFGANAGFHLLLAVVVALIPAAIYADLRLEGDRAAARLGAGLAAVTTAGYFATVMYSGMANSTAGAAFVALALAASNAARRGHRWGGVLLTLALTLTLYSHAAFYLYAAVILGVEVLFYRNWSGIGWLAIAFAASFVAALPVHWELLRYPAYYVTNNLYFDPPVGFDWAGLLRQIYYATEILLLPGRWFNDYVGLTHVWLPVIVWMAWRDRSRAGFYAWATLAIVLMLRFNAPQLGIISSRQMHLLPVVVAPAIAGFVDRHAPGGGWLRVALVLWIGLFVAVRFTPVPHLADVRSFDPTLVERLASRDGHLVLLENNPHWNMISTPGESTEESRFDVHYEALLPEATGKLFFGQPQDGFHRSRFRGVSLAGGGFRGRSIAAIPADAFAAELRRWGVRWLYVWSERSRRRLAADAHFVQRWSGGPWVEFELVDADPRSVVTVTGEGRLHRLTGVGGEVALDAVRRGDAVIVRTHYFPAWSARWNDIPIPLREERGQLAFDAPTDGSATIALEYDRRRWLSAIAVLALVIGCVLTTRIRTR